MNKTTTTLPTHGDIGTIIKIKPCGRLVGDVIVNPKNVTTIVDGEIVKGEWIMIHELNGSMIFKLCAVNKDE